MKFVPVPSTTPFIGDSDRFGQLILGPVGSTKTTAGVIKVAVMASLMAAGPDGIRRSRCAWVRQTREQLDDTSIPDFLKWFPDGVYGNFEKTKRNFHMRFGDVECLVMFRALDEAADVRKLLSLQLSFAVVEEFRELNPDIFENLQGRLGRFPDGMLVPHRPEWGVNKKNEPIQGCVTDAGKPNKHLWGMSNPPDSDTYWEAFLENPPDNFRVYKQVSGLSPDADWTKYLPDAYYEVLANGKTQDYVDVMIHAKYGKSLQGTAVFRCFDRDVHVAKAPLKVLSSPLLIGVDAGLYPAATLAQVSYEGQLLIHKTLIGVEGGIGALRFIKEILKPYLANHFPGVPTTVIIDPAAFQRAQTDERCVADIFKAQGFTVKPASTNRISARIAAVESYMTRTIGGKSAIIIDPSSTYLIQALRSKYRYRKKTNGDQEETPEKSHPWSDIADSLQYVCLQADGGQVTGTSNHTQARVIKRSGIRIGV